MTKIIKGLGALIILAAAVAGVPWLLIIMAGNPLPTSLDPHSLWRALTRPDDGTILIGLVAIIAWIAWLIFTASVACELIAALSRQRIRLRLPGLAGPQQVAGGLLLLVITMFVSPQQFAAADPAVTDHGPVQAGTTSATTTPARPQGPVSNGRGNTAPGERAVEDTVVHIVQPGDDLWTLSEHYYGKGQDWRRIARANPSLLTGGPDRLEPGWRLRIPDVDPGVRRVVVRPGDSLSAIAEREYGDAADWHRIYQANRGVLSDPDLLPIGLTLNLPVDQQDAEPADQAGGGRQRHADDHQGTVRSGDAHPGSAGTTGPGQQSRDRPQQAGGREGTQPSAAPATPRATPPANPSSAPTATAPTATAPTAAAPSADRTAVDTSPGEPDTTGAADRLGDHALQVAGIGGLLAAAVIGGLATRRQLQLRTRGVGRRIPQPPPAAQRLEAELGRRQAPDGLELLDLGLRAIGRDCHGQGRPLPRLHAARSSEDELLLTMSEPGLQAPVGFMVEQNSWRLSRSDALFLIEDGTVADAPQPYPGLTSIGTAPDGAVVLVNLEAAGLFAVEEQDSGPAVGVLTAMATELAFSPWADELVITLVGDDHGLADAIDRYNVSTVPDLDHLLDRWEQRARVQRSHLLADPGAAAGDYRIDPDLADPWVPEVGLVVAEPDVWQAERLERLLLSEPPVTLAAVVIGDRLMTDWRLIPDGNGNAELAPLDWTVAPQLIGAPVAELITDLIGTTGSQQTDPAPWWAADFPDGTPGPARALAGPPSDDQPDVRSAEDQVAEERAAQHPAPEDAAPDSDLPAAAPPDRELLRLSSPAEAAEAWPSSVVRTTDEPVEELVARSDADWAWLSPVDRPRASKESVIVPNPFSGGAPQTPRHPTIMLLGPAELLGAAGEPPTRAVMQCIEYCTWLLEHPGSTAQAMAAGLAVAEGTRRSNMSRLRNWLGSDDRGEPYLPDAYSGKIRLSPLVSSDWHRLQLLTHAGVNRTSTEGLAKALDLVRGAPLADAAPGQWHWAEEMRTDMVSVIRDIGVELTGRALAAADIDRARWAASRALTAAPQDEFLMGARIRTEHQAGNPAEVERLALQLAAQGRALGVDLHPDTIDLLQQVMEGRLRARA